MSHPDPSPHEMFKYKKVADRVVSVKTTLPKDYRITCKPHPNPLQNLPTLPTHDIPLIQNDRFTPERRDSFPVPDELWPEEKKLVLWLVGTHADTFAWDESERGALKYEYYPPIIIPTVEHIPWTEKSIPIPPAILPQVMEILRTKIATGVYEPTNSSYRH